MDSQQTAGQPMWPEWWTPAGLSIRKANEWDEDYLTDATGRYRLAIADLIARPGISVEDRKSWWDYSQTAVGGYRPLPQARKFHRSAARYRWALGGNRSSKSYSLGIETIWRLIGRHPWRRVRTPAAGWYATTTFDKLGELYLTYLKPLLVGIPHQIIWHNKAKDVPDTILIPVPGGKSRLVCKAFEQGRDSFQLAAVDFVHFDEQFGQDIFIEAISRIGAQQPADFAAALTPIVAQPWLEERFLDAGPADAVFSFPLDDNRAEWGGFIPGERIDALIEQWPEEVRDTRRFGRWGAYLGAVFPSFDRSIHVVDEAKERQLFWRGERPNSEIRPVGIIDWGGANPFCFLWATRIPWLDNEWYVFDELYWEYQIRGSRLLKDLAKDILDRTARWQTNLFRVWADHDPTNAMEMRSHGLSSAPANKVGSADEIGRAGIETIQTWLMPRRHMANEHWPQGRPRLHIAARCKELIRELPLYRWTSGTDNRDAKNVPVKKEDHAVDALRYLASSERDPTAGGAKRIELGAYRSYIQQG